MSLNSKLEGLLVKGFSHPKVGPVLLKIAENSNEEKAKAVGQVVGQTLTLWLSSWYVRRGLRALGVEKKQANRITAGGQAAFLLASYNIAAGKLKAQQVFELTQR